MKRTAIILWNALACAAAIAVVVVLAAWSPFILEQIPDRGYYLAAFLTSVGFLTVWAKRRWKFTFISMIVALPTIAMTALLISSFIAGQNWEYAARTDQWGLSGYRVVVTASHGGLQLGWNKTVYVRGGFSFARSPFPQRPEFSYSCMRGGGYYPLANEAQFAGFQFAGNQSAVGSSDWALTVPIPFLILLCGVAPWLMWRATRQRRLRRAAQNLCVLCGYDLRASPERCPECGKVPAGK